jgi:hypothetical protein
MPIIKGWRGGKPPLLFKTTTFLHFHQKQMNRQELQQNLISSMIKDMDLQTAMNIVNDYLEDDLNRLKFEELVKEIEEFYPHLLRG